MVHSVVVATLEEPDARSPSRCLRRTSSRSPFPRRLTLRRIAGATLPAVASAYLARPRGDGSALPRSLRAPTVLARPVGSPPTPFRRALRRTNGQNRYGGR